MVKIRLKLRLLLAIRGVGGAWMASGQALVATGSQGVDSISIPGVQGGETRRSAKKLLCGA
jgi:hypothetical protein